VSRGNTRTIYLLGAERLELREEAAREPGPGEIAVRIEAATTCGTDVKVFRRGGHPRMIRPPAPFGHEMAGTVEAVGPGAARWRPGDRVVVANSAACGQCAQCRRGAENLCADLQYLNGAFADRILVPRRFAERSTHGIPDALPFEVAALAEPLACVLHGIEASAIHGRSDVAVYGAGPIGLLFAGVLATQGHRVTLADPNEARLRVGQELGAARIVLLARGGGQEKVVVAEAEDPAGFDLAIDATGVPDVWLAAIASVRPGGSVNLFGGCAQGTSIPLDTHRIHYSEITVKGAYHHRPPNFARAIEVLAEGALDARLLLSAERPLEDVEEALRSMMRKEALKVVIRPGRKGPGA
jgi:L-iditol 2-dehydrogenase